MSWLDLPCRTVSALNRINAAILERLRYTDPNAHYSSYDPIPLPTRRTSIGTVTINNIRSNIRMLYKRHFPIANFGKWSKRRPYGELSENDLDLAIAGELTSAGIDPAGFFWQTPLKRSDGNFVMACYHLLNNVLLYALGTDDLDSQFFTQSMKTQRIDIETGDPFVTFDGSDGMIHGCAAMSRGYDQYASRHIDRRFVIEKSRYPKPQGDWRAKYHISAIAKSLLYPYNPEDKEQEIFERDVGTYEINFSGTQSDFISWHPLTIENINTYYSRGNDKYDTAFVYEMESISEILITRENLPPHNYQYID